MGLESASYINDLTTTNPIGASDSRSQGDDHIRLIKTVLKATFPNLGGRAWRRQAKTGTYTLAAADNMTLISCTSTPWTLSLTAAATLGNGHMAVLYNGGTGDLTIDPDGTEVVNGASTFALKAGKACLIFCTNVGGGEFLVFVMNTDNIQKFVPRADGVLAPHRNLVINYASAATVTVAADDVLLTDSSGNQKLFASLSVTPDMGVAGAGGLDTGAEGASRWYHIWAMGKDDGTKSVVFSESSSAPTLPTGYTYYGYLGAIYNDSGSAFDAMYQKDKLVNIPLTAIISNGTATSLTSLNSQLASIIPPTARAVFGRLDAINFAGGAAGDPISIVSADNTTVGYAAVGSTNANSSAIVVGFYRVILTTAQTMYYNNANGADYKTTIYASGWEY